MQKHQYLLVCFCLFSVGIQSFTMFRTSTISRISRVGSLNLRRMATTFPLTPKSAVKFQITEGEVTQWKGDMLAIPQFKLSQPTADSSSTSFKLCETGDKVDALLDGGLNELISEQEFTGKEGELASMRTYKGSMGKVSLIGMGESMDEVKLGENLANVANKEKCKTMAVALPSGADTQRVIQTMLGAMYVDNRFRSEANIEKPIKLSSVEFFTSEKNDMNIVSSMGLAEGVSYCRDLVNAPANVLYPETMAESASAMAKECGLECNILDKAQIEALGMGAYLGVAKGSEPGASDPRFIHLTYTPQGDVNRRVALVGKGLTFDSGGLNIKVAGSMMEKMKFDMGGAAAVLGAAKAIGLMKPQGVCVHFIVAACENMVSDRSMRPGDILTASNGKTIEVINTDAEGRLTLADALVFAEKLEVDSIVDIATLTGACVVSLGDKCAGMWSSDDALASDLAQSATKSAEKIWRMPLTKEYKEHTKSTIADLTNCGPREGGAITAALFLNEFVKSTPWAHLDIAGPVWGDKGATGFGVKLLVDYATGQGERPKK